MSDGRSYNPDITKASIDKMIASLRGRSGRARTVATVFLSGMLVVIFLGLSYYVGVPLIKQLQDGERRAWIAQSQVLAEQLSQIDSKRDALWVEIIERLDIAGTPLEVEWGAVIRDAIFIQDNQALMAAGTDGSLYFSYNLGESWSRRETGVKDSLESISVAGGRMNFFVLGASGLILKYSQEDHEVQVIDPPQDEGEIVDIEHYAFQGSDIFFSVSEAGTLYILNGPDTQWNALMRIPGLDYYDISVSDESNGVYFTGSNNFNTKSKVEEFSLFSEDGGENWKNLAETTSYIEHTATSGDVKVRAVLSYPGRVTGFERSTDQGVTWEGRPFGAAFPPSFRPNFIPLGDDGKFIMTSYNVSVILDDRYGEILKQVKKTPGSEGDLSIVEAYLRLPVHVQNYSSIRSLYDDLLIHISDRDEVERKLELANENAIALSSSGFSSHQAALEFMTLFDECRYREIDGSVCLGAIEQISTSLDKTVWHLASETAPLAVLLLLLIAFLGGLYRYNMKLSESYNMRADALEVSKLFLHEYSVQNLISLMNIFLSEKVDFDRDAVQAENFINHLRSKIPRD